MNNFLASLFVQQFGIGLCVALIWWTNYGCFARWSHGDVVIVILLLITWQVWPAVRKRNGYRRVSSDLICLCWIDLEIIIIIFLLCSLIWALWLWASVVITILDIRARGAIIRVQCWEIHLIVFNWHWHSLLTILKFYIVHINRLFRRFYFW